MEKEEKMEEKEEEKGRRRRRGGGEEERRRRRRRRRRSMKRRKCMRRRKRRRRWRRRRRRRRGGEDYPCKNIYHLQKRLRQLQTFNDRCIKEWHSSLRTLLTYSRCTASLTPFSCLLVLPFPLLASFNLPDITKKHNPSMYNFKVAIVECS